MFLFFVLFEIGKCSPVKFANFAGKITIFEPKVVILNVAKKGGQS
jgi:hypothetical protein